MNELKIVPEPTLKEENVYFDYENITPIISIVD